MADKSPDILNDVSEIKPLSPSAAALLELAGKEDHNLQDLVKIVKHDATLTAQILKMVNSAAYGFDKEITAIDRAISFTGENALVSLAMSEAAASVFASDMAGYEGQEGELWSHNLFTALAAKQVSNYAINPLNGDVAFTCGLLHDLGKAILSGFLTDTAAKVVSALEKGKVTDYASAEEKILGMDHCQAGFALARHWGLPEPLPSALRYHHTPQEAPEDYRAIVYAVHLGDMLAMMSGKATGADAMHYVLANNYSDYIAISEDELALIMIEIDNQFTKITESME